MPRFYFHIRDHDRLIRDEDGLELEDEDAALREAKAGALDMLDDALAGGENIAHQVIEICDCNGRPLGHVLMTDIIVRVPQEALSSRRRWRKPS